MRWLGNLLFRLRAIFARDDLERDLDEEMAFHLEMEERKLRGEGHTSREARRLARVAFGGVERHRERTRESWGITPLQDLGGDLRFAWRQLRKHPGFSLLAVVTLALGIGGTVAIFSVVDGVLLRPLPVRDEADLDVFWMDYDWRGVEYDFVRERVSAWSALAAYSNEAFTLHSDDGASLLVSAVASANLFDVLGAEPLLGRTFRPGEDRPGAEPAIVLSYATWQTRFGGDGNVVGRRVDVNGRATTVVGVMPREFYFPTPDVGAWTPLDLDPSSGNYQGNGWLVLMGRRAPGVTETRVQDDLTTLAGALGERFEYSEAWDKTRNPHVSPLREYLQGDARPPLLLLLGAVGLVLLMACANVAALILTRTADRTGEMSVRAAIGAGRARLARQVLTESVLLGLIAGTVGLLLAVALFEVLVAGLPLENGLADTLSLDWPAVIAALVLAAGAGALISLAPMRHLLAGSLSGGGFGHRRQGGGAGHSGPMQNALIVAEVLLAVVLVTGAGLLIRSVDRLRAIDPGLEPQGVLTVAMILGEHSLDEARRRQFLTDVVARAGALPGVSAAGLVNRVPIRDGGWQGNVTVADRPDLGGDRAPNAFFRAVTPGTFDALGATLVEGRGILPSDDEASPPVAVVNETFARRMWGGDSPLGRTIDHRGFGTGDARVVGVVRDIAVDGLVGEVPMAAYYSWSQTLAASGFGILTLRTDGDPVALVPAVRSLVHELEPSAAVGPTETMSAVVDGAMSETLRLRFFLMLFGVLGLVMGAVGIYGVVSYAVQRRGPEFGIRMALGARPGLLLGDVLRAGMIPVVVGIAGGVGVSLLASTLVSRFLYEVAPTDPAVLLAAGLVLGAVGVAASLVPAWRAGTHDPATALRGD